jgi:ABC-type branched-subunit amino acid transport system substrate-binding protein
MKNFREPGILFLSIACCLLSISSFSQVTKHKIAIFAPIYLDSAFDDANNYRYGKQLPKFINPGLEFVEGAQLALDTIAKEKNELEIFFYDTRSVKEDIATQLKRSELDDVEMILGYANPQESWALANFSNAKKIPYINVNLPNDAGITNNPSLVLLNSTLHTHIDQMYKYVQRNYPLNPIIVFRKKGKMEDVIKTYFDENAKNTKSVPLKIKWVDLTDSFTVNQLTAYLDSNVHSLCIAGSLDENFGKRLAVQLALGRSYGKTLLGMPTFDNIDFSRPEFKDLPIIYSTPFYNARTDKVSQMIVNDFNAKMFARPSDMVLRGYEATWRFAKLLLIYGKDISSNLTRHELNVFREFDIQPVINKQTNELDYFENKKLFFVKLQDGIVKGVN